MGNDDKNEVSVSSVSHRKAFLCRAAIYTTALVDSADAVMCES